MFVPQLLEKTPTKFRISKISYCKHPPPPPVQDTFGEQGRNYPGVCVGWGGDTPCLYLIGYTHTVSQIEK